MEQIQLLQNLTCEHQAKIKYVLSELTKNYSFRGTCQGCDIGKVGTAAIYSFCGYAFICNETCFQLYLDSIPYGCPG